VPTSFAEVRESVLAETDRPQTPIPRIDAAILKSISWLEKRHSFEWMARVMQRDILAGSTRAGPYDLPPNYKEPRALRLKGVETTGVAKYRYVRRVEPEDLAAVKLGDPAAYWIDGVQWLWFSGIPDTDATFEFFYFSYTGTMGPGDFHWLFDHGLDFVEAKSMQYLAAYLRLAPDVVQPYVGIAQDAYAALVEDNDRKQQAGLDLVLGMWEDGYGR
jgi:hypothetical protein